MPRGALDGTMLFYKSVLGFEAEPVHELVDPYGLIQSRVLESRDRTVRLPLYASASPRTATSQFLATYGGAGVHHIAIATNDIFATMTAMRASKVVLLDIPTRILTASPRCTTSPARRSTSCAGCPSCTTVRDGRVLPRLYARLRRAGLLEIVQRRDDDGFGAVHASGGWPRRR